MIDKKAVLHAVEVARKSGSKSPLKDVALAMGLNRSTVRWIASEESEDPDGPDVPADEPYRLGGSAADRKIIKLEDEVHRLRAELKAAHRQSLGDDEIRDILGTATIAPTEQPDWLTRLKASSKRTPEVPVLTLADPHAGEVVTPSEVNGVNEYNVRVLDRRFKRVIDQTMSLCDNYGPGNYPGIVVNLAGDNVSGGLHEELRKTDELSPLEATLHMRDLLAAGLRRLADHFGRVYVPAVAGNHGRATVRPEFKRYVRNNFDWLLYELLHREFANDKRIHVDTRDANEVYYRVFGKRFFLNHGDMMGVKGGDGIIGAIGPIMRGEVKMRAHAASSGMEYDVMIVGHWHQQIWLPRAIVANTMKGYDEYAKNALRAPITAPSQPLFFVHPRYGITSKLDVLCEEPAPPANANWVDVFNPARRAA